MLQNWSLKNKLISLTPRWLKCFNRRQYPI